MTKQLKAIGTILTLTLVALVLPWSAMAQDTTAMRDLTTSCSPGDWLAKIANDQYGDYSL